MTTNKDLVADWATWNESGFGPNDGRGSNLEYHANMLTSYQCTIGAYYRSERERHSYALVAQYVGRSPTTSRHIHRAVMAVGVPCFQVPTVGHPDHLTNIRFLWDELRKVGDRLVKEWDSDYDWRGTFCAAWEKVELYRIFTGVAFQLTPLDIMLEAIRSDRDDRRHVYYHPAAVAKRERNNARKLAREVLGV